MITSKGVNFIAQFEGFKETPYLCPSGCPTIGFGHVIRKGEFFDKITKEEGLILLKKDLQIYQKVISKLLTVSLSKSQYIAVLSLTYNIGPGAFQRSTLRQKINREEYEEIPSEFMKWIWGKGKILPGLVKRREAEIKLFIEKF